MISGSRVRAAVIVPAGGGPVRPREESRAVPVSQEPVAMPTLNAEVLSAEYAAFGNKEDLFG